MKNIIALKTKLLRSGNFHRLYGKYTNKRVHHPLPLRVWYGYDFYVIPLHRIVKYVLNKKEPNEMHAMNPLSRKVYKIIPFPVTPTAA